MPKCAACIRPGENAARTAATIGMKRDDNVIPTDPDLIGRVEGSSTIGPWKIPRLRDAPSGASLRSE